MGFFDLNIPYLELQPSDKTTAQKATRTKLATKAMELGYTGIAYNRTMKGVMSDKDRCSIPLLSLSSLLKVAPSLSSSVNFHRDLLGVPRSSPFRQYTRLTVCVESIPQGQALNSGNPILKSYDIVAVRPLNQSTFDYACERAEVDMISINFSDKLPFRLKLPMVKAAIEREVYFEITYSDIILDPQARRQIMSNAKLLVDWTRGKNLIFSSAASSATELRGPNDVANLSCLLGLSTERAKAAISKNCRTLIAKALKKKYFHKEAIRVEVVSSNEQLNSKEAWLGDWLNWDPISSGEGDLLLDDVAKAFTATSKGSKTVKAIDFASVVDSIPSHGFQVKDLISGKNTVPQQPANCENFSSASEVADMLPATTRVSKQSSRVDIIPETDWSTFDNDRSRYQQPGDNDTQGFNLPSNTAKPSTHSEEVGTHTDTTAEKLFSLQRCNSTQDLCVELHERVTSHTLAREIALDPACSANGTVEVSALSEEKNFTAPQSEEYSSAKSSDVDLDAANVVRDRSRIEVYMENGDTSLILHGQSLPDHVLEKEPFVEQEDNTVVADQTQYVVSCEEIKVNNDSLVGNHEAPELMTAVDREISLPTLVSDYMHSHENGLEGEPFIQLGEDMRMEEQKDGEAHTEISHSSLVQSLSGKSRGKRRVPHQAPVLPFKHFLNPVHFKRRGKKSKHRRSRS